MDNKSADILKLIPLAIVYTVALLFFPDHFSLVYIDLVIVLIFAFLFLILLFIMGCLAALNVFAMKELLYPQVLVRTLTLFIFYLFIAWVFYACNVLTPACNGAPIVKHLYEFLQKAGPFVFISIVLTELYFRTVYPPTIPSRDLLKSNLIILLLIIIGASIASFIIYECNIINQPPRLAQYENYLDLENSNIIQSDHYELLPAMHLKNDVALSTPYINQNNEVFFLDVSGGLDPDIDFYQIFKFSPKGEIVDTLKYNTSKMKKGKFFFDGKFIFLFDTDTVSTWMYNGCRDLLDAKITLVDTLWKMDALPLDRNALQVMQFYKTEKIIRSSQQPIYDGTKYFHLLMKGDTINFKVEHWLHIFLGDNDFPKKIEFYTNPHLDLGYLILDDHELFVIRRR